jgi:chemotaxis protein CheY-P-specific phosphatase CheC
MRELNETELDALKEIINIGAGKAADQTRDPRCWAVYKC